MTHTLSVLQSADCLMARYRNEPWFVDAVAERRESVLLIVKAGCPFVQHRKIGKYPVRVVVSGSKREEVKRTIGSVLVDFRGKQIGLCRAARLVGIKPETVKSRVRLGMTAEDALALPPMRNRWQSTELETLRKAFLSGDVTKAAELVTVLGRDAKSIRRKARELGVVGR